MAEKLALIERLEDEVALLDEQLTALEAELQTFWVQYSRRIGVLYSELDAIEAEAATLRLQMFPQDARLLEEASHAALKAEASHEAAHRGTHSDKAASADIRSLFRQAARRFHPDLAQGREEEIRCGEFMKRANAAFEETDAEQLRELLREWDDAPATITSDDIGSHLIRAIREIAALRRRRLDLEIKKKEVEQTELCVLYYRLAANLEQGLGRLEDKVKRSIQNAESELQELKSHAARRI